MSRLGIDRLSVFDMPPPDFARLAAGLGCDSISLCLEPAPRFLMYCGTAWSLRGDKPLRRQLKAALAETGVGLALLEGFAVVSGRPVSNYANDLDVLVELGGERVGVVSLERDRQRTIDEFRALAEMARQRGLEVSCEVGTMIPAATIEEAYALQLAVGMPNFSLMIDAMHYFRLGNTVEQLAELPPHALGYVQLCDVPRISRFPTYIEEALYERMVPGEGELPLQRFVACLPDAVTVSLEIPRRSLLERGVTARDRLAPCVAAARALLREKASLRERAGRPTV